jgi:hypothetical protein
VIVELSVCGLGDHKSDTEDADPNISTDSLRSNAHPRLATLDALLWPLARQLSKALHVLTCYSQAAQFKY